ncbi:MAG: winged helix-turn-helix domain-containing protein, partial [Rhodocyclaceae bacterium]|nr:winged helix-turn-helix domain-containing protein [Rhodocyclaceae bacterium]
PRLTGMELLNRCRLRGQVLPVLILTARDDTSSKVAGLDAGADDYLVKPIDLDELFARVRALARRAVGRSFPVLRHGTLTLDPASRCVTQAGQTVDLSAREFDVLQTLLEHAGRVMSRAQIEASLYGWREEPDSNVLEVHVHHLRRKLGNTLIKTMRGVGYVIERVRT